MKTGFQRKKEELKMEDKKHEIIEKCKDYLSAFPDARKVVFIAKELNHSELDIKSYISLLMESYGLSQSHKYKRNPISDSRLSSKCSDFIELCKISDKVIELETHQQVGKEAVYNSFVESMNFYRKHNLSFDIFSKNIKQYVDTFCNDETMHRLIGDAVIKWLNNEQYTEELLCKFKECNFSLGYNLKKIMDTQINTLSKEEKEFLKAKCVDEIMLDKIICDLYRKGYLKDLKLGQIQISGANKKADSLASQLETSKYWYITLMSIEKQKFIPNFWLF